MRLTVGPGSTLLLTCCTVRTAEMFWDEVTECYYCLHTAGPLAWDEITYQAYGMAREMQSADIRNGSYGRLGAA